VKPDILDRLADQAIEAMEDEDLFAWVSDAGSTRTDFRDGLRARFAEALAVHLGDDEAGRLLGQKPENQAELEKTTARLRLVGDTSQTFAALVLATREALALSRVLVHRHPSLRASRSAESVAADEILAQADLEIRRRAKNLCVLCGHEPHGWADEGERPCRCGCGS